MRHMKNKKRGFSLVETILYLTFLVIIISIVVSFVVSLAKTYQSVQAVKNVESSAVFSLERITRDIRNAYSVNTAGDTLILNTSDASGNAQSVKFYISPTTHALSVDTDGVYVGPLTLSDVTVDDLHFTLATSSRSEAVKVGLSLTGVVGGASTTKNFYTTVVLRGSY